VCGKIGTSTTSSTRLPRALVVPLPVVLAVVLAPVE
jgi:hypothetical protein